MNYRKLPSSTIISCTRDRTRSFPQTAERIEFSQPLADSAQRLATCAKVVSITKASSGQVARALLMDALALSRAVPSAREISIPECITLPFGINVISVTIWFGGSACDVHALALDATASSIKAICVMNFAARTGEKKPPSTRHGTKCD